MHSTPPPRQPVGYYDTPEKVIEFVASQFERFRKIKEALLAHAKDPDLNAKLEKLKAREWVLRERLIKISEARSPYGKSPFKAQKKGQTWIVRKTKLLRRLEADLAALHYRINPMSLARHFIEDATRQRALTPPE